MTTAPGGGQADGRLLARNVGFNLVGHGVPLLAAVFAIPLLIAELGTERFGVLTLVWVLVGYFSLFDLGLGRALTQAVAERIGAGREDEIPGVAWTALLLMLLLGSVGALLLGRFVPWIVDEVLTIPAELAHETRSAFLLLAYSLPIIITTAGFRGVLEAKQCFGLVNAIRLPLGIFFFVGPLLVLPFSSSLVPIVAVTLAGRVAGWIAHAVCCFREIPRLRHVRFPKLDDVGRLLRFGGWMTVSNVISPLMVYLDRFLIGALLSVAAVAYYVTPHEVVTKLWVLSGALTGVLFPAFAMSFAGNRERMVLLLDRGLKISFAVIFPFVLLLVALAHEGLEVWLGPVFAQHSAPVLQWLAVGVFITSISTIPFNAVQGAGRADLIAKLHLIELPLYLLLAWWLIGAYGIIGAAAAWGIRIAVDAVVFFVIMVRLVPESASVVRQSGVLLTASIVVLAGAALVPPGFSGKAAFLVVVGVGVALVMWFAVLNPEDRTLVRALLPLSRSGFKRSFP
jgi:O-antigen/teichoic acid export membrane protein